MSKTTYTATTTSGTEVTRTTATMAYTHVVVGTDGAYSWHTSKALADKAAAQHSGSKVVPAVVQEKKAKAPAKAAAKKATTPAKGKAPAKAKATTPKKATAQGVLATKSGVSHPGPLWLKAMTDKGLSQTACATEMGVAPMTLNRLINGHGIPTARVTLAFARVTKQPAKKVWQQVADFELALAEEADAN